MYPDLSKYIEKILTQNVSEERKIILQLLTDFIRQNAKGQKPIRINFICTHNSRRSHLAQIWAHTAALHFKVSDVQCYSGGTEATALFPEIAEILIDAGFKIWKLDDGKNPVYAIKCAENASPVIGFSKKYDDLFNPVSNFAAVMTCSQADDSCPFIHGAKKRIPITFEDPKISDHTSQQAEVYRERSLQIAAEMFYVFSRINNQDEN
jgi:arsenate reductase